MRKTAAIAIILSMAAYTALPVYAVPEDIPAAYTYEMLAAAEDQGEGISVTEYEDTEQFDMPEAVETAQLSEAEQEVVYISTVDDLKQLRDNTNNSPNYTQNKRFVLTNSIDLGGIEWNPIGYNPARAAGDNDALTTYSFKGEFDGNGNVISNFKMTASDHTYLGFFGTVNGGTVKNLALEDVNITYKTEREDRSLEFAGLLCAFANYATIENCELRGNISVSFTASDKKIMAGMVAGAGVAKISGCTADGTMRISASGAAYAGGIQGYASNSTAAFNGCIKGCTSAVSVNAESKATVYAAGIIARSSSNMSDISDCIYAPKSGLTIISKNDLSADRKSGYPIYAAGIAGYNYCDINNCKAGSATVSAETPVAVNMGGIAGRNLGSVDRCSSDADLSAWVLESTFAATPSVGGIVGACGLDYNALDSIAPLEPPSVTNCTVSDKVAFDVESAGSRFVVAGGIGGMVYAPSKISNCTAAVTSMKLNAPKSGIYAGGIAGYLLGASVERCVASGKLGDEFNAPGTLYLGGIAGDANVKFFLTYKTGYGVVSSEFVESKVYGASISECSAAVDITANTTGHQNIGGIAGFVKGQYSSAIPYIKPDRDLRIADCAYDGSITVAAGAESYIGGIAGYLIDGYMSDSRSSGSIENLADNAASRYFGGGVGYLKQNDHEQTSPVAGVENSCASVSITAPKKVLGTVSGAFIGALSPSSKSGIAPFVNGCYYAQSGLGDTSGAAGLTESQLADISSFKDWNFENKWEITGEKPTLRFERCCIYEREIKDGRLASLTISRPTLNDTVYAVVYKDGQFITAHPVKLGADVFETSSFTTISVDYDIPADAQCSLYIWSSTQEPRDTPTDL